jgi:hypothetical protein
VVFKKRKESERGMEANGTGQILTDSERWTVNGGTIASRTSTTTRTSTIWKANGGQESERGTGQIAKVQKVKGGQVKSRRFLTFPRRFPNGFAPRSDLMEGWKGGRVEGSEFSALVLFLWTAILTVRPGKIRIMSVRRARERYQHEQSENS